MQKHYEKIAKKAGVRPQAVHLVHFVLARMKDACVFPPDTEAPSPQFYSPLNICSAILSWLRHKHGDNPWGTLVEFGIQSSVEVGRIVESVQANSRTRVVRDLGVDPEAWIGLFRANPPTGRLKPVRWIEGLEDDVVPKCTTTEQVLRAHFAGRSFESLVISKRRFPEHVRADLQLALEHVLQPHAGHHLYGVNVRHYHEGINFRSLTETHDAYAARTGPLSYSEVGIGDDETVRCLSNGLWLATDADRPFAVVLGQAPAYSQTGGVQIEVATAGDEDSRQFAAAFFDRLQQSVEASKCFRGKILSFEHSDDYRGHLAAIKVHQLKHVARDEVILPRATVELLDRNVIEFVRQRPELKNRGMNLKKGLLLFGPPGTGKTHTVHYLSRALPQTTTLIITSEQVGLLSHYMTLARLLQPSLVIIEDADLIGRQREEMGTCEEVLLNKLLNEMDGLRADAEIIFILTTNRPESLEAALTARPGRIDQAIEFPLPDNDGRRRLARLYAGTQTVADDVLETIVNRTEGTSAAFIKELMRRATQYAITRGGSEPISVQDIEIAVEEMLFSGGAFNRRLLGAGNSHCDSP